MFYIWRYCVLFGTAGKLAIGSSLIGLTITNMVTEYLWIIHPQSFIKYKLSQRYTMHTKTSLISPESRVKELIEHMYHTYLHYNRNKAQSCVIGLLALNLIVLQ